MGSVPSIWLQFAGTGQNQSQSGKSSEALGLHQCKQDESGPQAASNQVGSSNPLVPGGLVLSLIQRKWTWNSPVGNAWVAMATTLLQVPRQAHIEGAETDAGGNMI